MSSGQEIAYESFLINTSEYNETKKLGRGRFGTMYLAEKKDGTKYAIREVDSDGGDQSTHDFFREVELYIQIRAQPAICKFYGFQLSPQKIVLEYLEKGSLKNIFDKLLKKETVKEWNGTMKSKTVFGIATALLQLQNHGAFHRFLTPASILFDSNYEPRLVDFAFAKVDTGTDTAKTVIKNKSIQIYQAPELDDNANYDFKVDNYSFGVILYQIVTGKEAFNSKGVEYKVKTDIHNGIRPPVPEDECPKLAPIISDLWDGNPEDRPMLIDIIKALYVYDEPLFPGTDMDKYKEYRERIIKSTYLTEEQLNFIKQPNITDEDEELFEKHLDNAQKGNVKDMVKVARDFERGIGTDQSIEDAIDWYQKAANKNDPEALYKLANFYCIGCYALESDQDQYVKYLKKAADKNYPPAIIDYAVLLQTGNSGVTQDIDKAEEMFKKMANKPNNYGEAQYFLAKLYESKNDIEEAVKYYQMARENGIEGAHCDYALILLDGKGEYVNQPEGIKILKQAADRGFPMANYNLGHIYEYGSYNQEKSKANSEKAFNYYKAAADKGMAAAMVKVAKGYFRGKFGEYACGKDPILAARLFEHAAALGDPEGLHSWGTFLNHYSKESNPDLAALNVQYGGTPMNLDQAIEFYKKAAEAGFVPSMVRLGELYDKGVAGGRDAAMAKHYLKMAVDKGSKVAVELLKNLNEAEDDDE